MAPSVGFNDHEIVEAFRKVDPSVRLVLLIEDGEDKRGRTAIEKGFDAAVNPARDIDLMVAAIPNLKTHREIYYYTIYMYF